MTTTVILDMGGEPIEGLTLEQELRAWAHFVGTPDATFRVLQEVGPAGGAPEVEWTFASRADAERAVMAYTGNDREQTRYLIDGDEPASKWPPYEERTTYIMPYGGR
jgi:hypothetical protein